MVAVGNAPLLARCRGALRRCHRVLRLPLVMAEVREGTALALKEQGSLAGINLNMSLDSMSFIVVTCRAGRWTPQREDDM
jgi:hypothetical protein